MVLVQLLLPTASGGDSSAALAETRRELAAQFTGVTAYARAPAKGLWTNQEGETEQDDVIMVEVVTDTFDRVWWRKYAVTLAQRFAQERMHIRAIPVEMLDDRLV